MFDFTYNHDLTHFQLVTLFSEQHRHTCSVPCCRTVNGSKTACGQGPRDQCVPQYENTVNFELPQSPSPEICVSVIVNNVLQVNMTSPLWCEYLLNVGQF